MRKNFFDPEPFIFGHRGMSEYPENTYLSFKNAADTGVDVIETDLHISRDGKFFIFHDATLDRVTDGKGKINDFTLDELKKFDAAYNFSNDGASFPYRGKGIRILSLEELLETFPGQRFNIELKDCNPASVEGYCGVIRKFNADERVLTASEHYANIVEVRRILPEMATSASMREVINIYFLFKIGMLSLKKSYRMDALQIPEFVSFSRLANPGMVKMLKSKGVRVHVWTINKEEEMRRLIEIGVDGIITDEPALLKKVLRSYR